MLMKQTPVRGMRDILPSQMLLRNYLFNIIRRHATTAGFQEIATPAVEHLENLTSKDGGENESLIFKIEKRGADYAKALKNGEELADSALRYDLTVPLARYYAENNTKLPNPFKSLQIASVWRADAPQKGRFREFTQCDLDILGDNTILAEISVVSTVLKILNEICAAANISGLTLHLNDRRLLLAATALTGFSNANSTSDALIALDKRDKIGFDGVAADLRARGYDDAVINNFLNIFRNLPDTLSVTDFCARLQNTTIDPIIANQLELIISTIHALNLPNAKVVFSPTLVRGMAYYTGPIFECTIDGFNSSIAGGGRYDHMIEKFSGHAAGACGFSIGFERLLAILEDRGFTPPFTTKATAILIDKNLSPARYPEILAHADKLRQNGITASVLPMSRNLTHQIDTLLANGFTEFEKVYNNS